MQCCAVLCFAVLCCAVNGRDAVLLCTVTMRGRLSEVPWLAVSVFAYVCVCLSVSVSVSASVSVCFVSYSLSSGYCYW